MTAPTSSRRCKDCLPSGKRPAPHVGPRCATHHREFKKRAKLRERDMQVQRRYGITPEEYAALKRYQDDKCAVCGNPLTKSREPDIDHDHAHCSGPKGCRECVRGALHGRCNRWLAFIEDNPQAGIMLFEYLKDPPFKRMREGR